MKLIIMIFGIFSIITFCFATCEKKCWGVSCAEPINFKIVDKTTQKDLIFGINSRYKLDSLQLNRQPDSRLGYHQNYLSKIHGNEVNGLVASTGKFSIDTTYLRLSFSDHDTLIINYVYEENKCCTQFNGFGKISAIKYNGLAVTKIDEIFKFEKE